MVYNSSIARGTQPSFTSGSNAANALFPIEMQREIIKVATEKSFIGSIARRVDMGTKLKHLPVLSAKPTAYWVNGDSGLKQTTSMAWKDVTLVAEELAVLVPIPINVIEDLDMDIWAQIKPEVEEAVAIALDAAVLFGTNKPSSWPTALATGAIAAGNTVTQGTGVDVAADVNNVIAALAADGFVPREIGMRESLRWVFQGLRTTTNAPIFQPNNAGVQNTSFGNDRQKRKDSLWGLPAMAVLNGAFEAENTASANAVNLVVVDGDQVVLGVRQDMRVDFSKDAAIFDANGDLQFNAFQQDGIIGRFTARYAYAIPNPITRLQPTEGNRWPASVMRDAA